MIRKAITLFTLLTVCLVFSSAAHARGRSEAAEVLPPQPEELSSDAEQLPLDPAVTIGKLDNGISYYLRPNDEPENRVYLRLVVNAGSVLEDDDQQGLAHFVEHAAFLGTEDFDYEDIVAYLESLGMRFGPDVNAYTSFDETVYMLQIPADDPAKIERGVHILQQWAHAVRFDPERVATERDVILEEWRVGLGANQRFRDQQFPILFRDSRYAERLPIGIPEVFSQAGPEDLRAFYDRWYRPELMSVIAVGEFDPADMEDLITQYFAGIQPRTPPGEEPPRPLYAVPQHEQTLFAPFSDPEAGHTTVSIYNKQAPQPLRSKQDYRTRLQHRLFATALNNRFTEINRRPDAPFLAAGAGHGRLVRTVDAAFLQVVTEEDGILAGLEALLIEALRVQRHGFSEAEIERARRQLLRFMQSAYNERENTDSQIFTTEYTRHFLNDEAFPGIEHEWRLIQQLLPGISTEDVNRLSDQYLADSNRVITVSAAETDRTDLPDEQQLQSLLADVQQRTIEPRPQDAELAEQLMMDFPEPGGIITESYDQETATTEWVLSNGVTVVLRPTDFRSDQIRLHTFSMGGQSLYEDELLINAAFAPALAELSGIAHLDRTDLERQLSGQDVQLSPFIDSYTQGFSGSSSVDDFETMLQLLHLYTTSPRHTEDAQTFLLRQLRATLERRQDQPDAVFSDRLQELLADGDSRRRPIRSQDLEDLDFETARNIYLERFTNMAEAEIILVGSFDPDEIRPLVELYLATLPAGSQAAERIPHPVEYPRGKIQEKISIGQDNSSRVAIVYSGSFTADQNSLYHLSALADAMRMQLREAIREDEGGTYGVSVATSSQRYPTGSYRLTIGFNTDPERVEQLTSRVDSEIDQLRREGPSQSIVQRVAETHRRDYERNLRSNGFWINQLSAARYHNQPLQQFLDQPELIDQLSAEVIQQAAERFLSQEDIIQLTLYPAEEE